MKLLAYCLAAALGVALTACDDSDAGGARRLAYLTNSPGRSNLVAPDTVYLNTPFEVTAIGWGSGTRVCNDPAGTKVDYATGIARIEAYMIYPTRGDIVCTADLRSYPQKATISFSSLGTTKIRLMGLSSASYPATVDSIEKTVVVMPTR